MTRWTPEREDADVAYWNARAKVESLGQRTSTEELQAAVNELTRAQRRVLTLAREAGDPNREDVA